MYNSLYDQMDNIIEIVMMLIYFIILLMLFVFISMNEMSMVKRTFKLLAEI